MVLRKALAKNNNNNNNNNNIIIIIIIIIIIRCSFRKVGMLYLFTTVQIK